MKSILIINTSVVRMKNTKMLADATRQELPYQNLKTPLPLKG